MLLVSSGPVLTSILHPNNQWSPGWGFNWVCVSVCSSWEDTHTHTHKSPPWTLSLLFCFSSVTQERGDCVCFSEGVFYAFVCVCVRTQYTFSKGAFLCSCHPNTRQRSVGNNERVKNTYKAKITLCQSKYCYYTKQANKTNTHHDVKPSDSWTKILYLLSLGTR